MKWDPWLPPATSKSGFFDFRKPLSFSFFKLSRGFISRLPIRWDFPAGKYLRDSFQVRKILFTKTLFILLEIPGMADCSWVIEPIPKSQAAKTAGKESDPPKETTILGRKYNRVKNVWIKPIGILKSDGTV